MKATESEERWLIRVSGNPGDLDQVAEFLTPLDLRLIERNGEKYLTSPKFESLPDARAVLDLASELLAVINGMLIMTTGDSGNLRAGQVLRSEKDRLPTQYIFPEGIHSASRVGIPTVHMAGQPPPGPESHPFYRLLDFAERHEPARKVLRMLASHSLDWRTLYSIYEVIENDAGGKISSRGWASENELSLFRRTANHPAASGDEARHGVLNTEPPASPMPIHEGRALIKRLVGRWLRESTRT